MRPTRFANPTCAGAAVRLRAWAAAALCLMAGPALAQTCTVSVTATNFGTIDLTTGAAWTTTATFSTSCTNGPVNGSIRMCISFGSGTGGGAATGSPRLLLSGGNQLQYSLYTSAAYTTVWGSYSWAWSGTYPGVQIDIPTNAARAGSATRTIYGRISPSQQTLPTGTYTSNFTTAHTLVRYANGTGGSCAAGTVTARTVRPTFTVSATYAPVCRVAASTLDFGSIGLLGSIRDAASALSVTCSNGTAYTAALDNGLGAGVTGPTARKMTGPASATVTYGLYRDAARSLPWGTGVGLVYSGTGAGTAQNVPVYGRVPVQATPAPGSYSDTIVVTITY